MTHLRLVPTLPRNRSDLDSLARRAVAFALRRLRSRGIEDGDAAISFAKAAIDQLVHHPHHDEADTLGRLCAAIEQMIDRSAGETGKVN